MKTGQQLHMCIHDNVHYIKAVTEHDFDAWHDFDSNSLV